MILFCVTTRSGENEYESYGYYENFTAKDFRNDKLSDLTILSEYYDQGFTEEDAEGNDGYWYDDEKIVRVKGVWDITREELKTLHKFGIIYYLGES